MKNQLDTLDAHDIAWPATIPQRIGCVSLGLVFIWLAIAGIWKTVELLIALLP